MSKVSVIVPCYKCHSYLDRLLASLAMQTMYGDHEFEVMLVNDCCPEGSYDSFVKFWKKKMTIGTIDCSVNGGPGKARQIGIDNTSSDYIMFADSDDAYMGDIALDVMMSAMDDGESDIILGKFIEETRNHSYIEHDHDLVWVFAKIYKRKFLEDNNIRFNDTRANEDTGFNQVCGGLTERINTIENPIYIWHYQPNTITRINDHAYTHGDGFRGCFANHAWAHHELQERGVDIKEKVLLFLAKAYYMFEDMWRNGKAEEKELNCEYVYMYFSEIVHPMLENGLTYSEIMTTATNYMKQVPCSIVPEHTFFDFLNVNDALVKAQENENKLKEEK